MRQRQVIKEVAESVDLKQTEVKKVVDKIIDYLHDALKQKQELDIQNFGVFELVKHKEKQAVIPGKDEKVVIPEHFKAQFRVGKELKEQLNKIEK